MTAGCCGFNEAGASVAPEFSRMPKKSSKNGQGFNEAGASVAPESLSDAQKWPLTARFNEAGASVAPELGINSQASRFVGTASMRPGHR